MPAGSAVNAWSALARRPSTSMMSSDGAPRANEMGLDMGPRLRRCWFRSIEPDIDDLWTGTQCRVISVQELPNRGQQPGPQLGQCVDLPPEVDQPQLSLLRGSRTLLEDLGQRPVPPLRRRVLGRLQGQHAQVGVLAEQPLLDLTQTIVDLRQTRLQIAHCRTPISH